MSPTKQPTSSRRDFIRVAGAAALASGSGRLRGAERGASARSRAEEADRLVATQVAGGAVAAAVLLVRQDAFEFARAHGRAEIDTPFLIASPTKPMTVSAVMWLRERGELGLADRVRKFLPEFRGDGREAVTIRHLLTHTSGLPDMLPENTDLRKRHAPLREFVARTCRTPLLFSPGEKVSYQSMGTLLAAAIVEKVSGQAMPVFLEKNIFGPLRMTRSSLGLGGRPLATMAQCQVAESERSDWDWNSAYWRNLAAPWGGAHSTARDLAAFAEAFGRAGEAPWSPETRREMRVVQTGGLHPPYGYGWRLGTEAFGGTCSPATFGHHGATGTVVWHDPASRVTCVVLTTRALAESRAGLIDPVCAIVGRSARG